MDASKRIEVVACGLERRAIAARQFVPGERIVTVAGLVHPEPSRHSLEVDTGVHVAPPANLDAATLAREYPWVFLEHSCDPNARVVGRDVVAWRAIAPGEAVTFDYRTTESELAAPFPCTCGAVSCRGELVLGWRRLDPAVQARLAAQASPHLLRRPAASDRAT